MASLKSPRVTRWLEVGNGACAGSQISTHRGGHLHGGGREESMAGTSHGVAQCGWAFRECWEEQFETDSIVELEKKKAVATVADGSPQKYKPTQKKAQVYHVQEMPGLGVPGLGMESMYLVAPSSWWLLKYLLQRLMLHPQVQGKQDIKLKGWSGEENL